MGGRQSLDRKLSRTDDSSRKTEEHLTSTTDEDKPKWEDVVISGVSCRLPESDNMAEFRDNLMNGVDMVTENDRRWKQGIYGLPKGNGKLKGLSKFDAEFFGVSPKQADTMEPKMRLLLEVAYETLVDAGQCPETIKGSNTGVFIGASSSEAHEAWASDPETVSGYTMTGCYNSFLANRISFFFNLKGPSAVFDTACSSSCTALHYALRSIRTGQCDAALVGGASMCLKPSTSVQFKNIGMLSPGGRCKAFDANADGYCRSDGIVMIYLQKTQDARRIYCYVVNTGTNCDGYKHQGLMYPSREMQHQLLECIYNDVEIDPSSVHYIEAHGTGTQAGDTEEANMISDFFCQNRTEALLIGSVKSNMGHCETASGMVSIAKVIVAMEEGVIPGNLHFRQPNPNIPGFRNNKIKVVDKNTVWGGGYVGVNNFGFGGSNGHVILKSAHRGNAIIRSKVVTTKKERKLLCYSARTEDGVKLVLQQAKLLSTNDHFLAMITDSNKLSPMVQTYRGYTVLNDSSSTDNIIINKSQSDKRPVWYVFAGMGCQWPGMGRQMMSLETFRKSILKCERALYPYGINLSQMLMSDDESMYEDIVNAFVAIAAIQVAIVDLLHTVGVEPDGLIGHSAGELGCAYADGCFTAEETVHVAYWRGCCIKNANLPPGKMAVLGLTWDEASKRCPRGVVPACHNAADNVTVSGPRAAVEELVRELGEQNIFAKEVNSAGFAFHSYFMKAAEASLYTQFTRVIRGCSKRSQKWISTSVKQNDWESDLAKVSSPEYHVNNVLNPVLFHEALLHIPSNAIVIEVAPHGILKAILKRALSENCYISSVMQRSSNDNVEFCLTALGNLYLNGGSVISQALLTPVTYPVPSGTPMLSPLVSWKHENDWQVPSPEMFVNSSSTGHGNCYTYVIDTSDGSEYNYLTGHKIDGRILFPAAGYLMLAWKSYAKSCEASFHELPVSFENVHFQRATILSESGQVTLVVTFLPVTGNFEVVEGNSVVASGRILPPSAVKTPEFSVSVKPSTEMVLSTADVYKEMRLRGYEYEGLFKGIMQLDLDGVSGELRWSQNFVAFVDTMLQMVAFSQTDQDLRLPTKIKSICIDPLEHSKQVKNDVLQACVDVKSGTCYSGGVTVTGLVLHHFPLRRDEQPRVDLYKLFPHDQAFHMPENLFQQNYVRINLQLAKQLVDYQTDQSVETSEHVPNDEQCNGLCKDDYKNDKFALLKALRVALNEGIAKGVGSEDVLRKAIKEDCIFSSITKPEYLSPCIETVIENVRGDLKVIELSPPNMKNHIEYILCRHVNLQFSYDVIHVANDSESGVEFPLTTDKPHLIVVDNILHHQADLKSFVENLVNSLEEGGFLLVKEVTRNFILQCITEDIKNDGEEKYGDPRSQDSYYKVETLQDIFTKVGLMNIYEFHDNVLSSMFLLRKKFRNRTENNRILEVSDLGCEWLEELKGIVKELKADPKPGENLWLYADNSYSGILGMVNCLKLEPEGHRIRCVVNNRRESCEKIEGIVDAMMEKDLVVNVLKDNVVGSYREVPFGQETVCCDSTGYCYVDVQIYGDLSSIAWFQSSLEIFKQNAENEVCKVEYASLNFRDVMLATGKLSPDAIPGNNSGIDCLLGMEFSGSDSNGVRVMGIVSAKALATHVDVRTDFLWEIPLEWSFMDAASVPVAYSTTYYALLVRGHLRHGEKVLIHSGSGGVGQAAISIALSYGCEVFTTVGTEEKRMYLMETFPELKPENMFSSRDTSFQAGILDATSGYGVDIVLNSLSGVKLKASLNLVALHGRFLEIGKVDLFSDTDLGMSTFLKNMSFHGILLDSLFENGNWEWKEVSRLIKDGIKSGTVRPLKTTVYKSGNVEEAFRYMAHGKHIGKILIEVGVNTMTEVSAIPKFVCSSKKSYIIIGGLGGFGLELAQWLANKGARSIVLTSRSGVRNGYQERKIRKIKKSGVEVTICRKNAVNMRDAEEIINECSLPLGGVFNTAMVLDDGLIDNQTVARFRRVIEPKLTVAMNFDKITRATCKDSCDYFVMFSSVCSGRGNAGQSNYGFANSGMERICEQRKRDGLHGLAIQWGVIGDVGAVFEKYGHSDIVIADSITQRLRSCFATLDVLLTQSEPIVSCSVQASKQSKVENVSPGNTNDLLKAVCHIIGIKDSSKVDDKAPLESFGLDSLMTVEIIQTIEQMIDVRMKASDIRELTFQKIANMNKKGLKLVPEQDHSISQEKNQSLLSLEDILIPKEVIVPLNENKNENKSRTEPLYILHTIEGTTNILRHLASFIERPVFGIQCTKDVPLASISGMAQYYKQALLQHNNFKSFHLAGYSYGGLVSLEIAYQFGQSDVSSELLTLILLDGTHISVATTIRMYLQKLGIKDDVGQKTMALALLGEGDPEELWYDLSKLPTYEERVEKIVSKLRLNNPNMPEKDFLDTVEAFYQRQQIALEYSFPGILDRDVVLITPDDLPTERKLLGSDQGLREIVEGSVNVYTVQGTHQTYLQGNSGKQVARYINKELSK